MFCRSATDTSISTRHVAEEVEVGIGSRLLERDDGFASAWDDRGDAISNQAERRWQPLDQRHFGVGLKQGLRSVEAARPGPDHSDFQTAARY